MRTNTSRAVLATLFAVGVLAAPVAMAEEGKTSSGGTSANSGSSSEKGDKGMQETSGSADKSKQHR